MIPFLRRYFSSIIYPVLWTLVIGILLSLPGSVLPQESDFSIPQFDKIIHISLFGGFVFLWGLYLSSKPITTPRKLLRLFFLIFILGSIYGIGMEYVQKYFIPNRDFDLADIIADLIGAGLAYGICNLTLVKV
ncbi:VanZ family protein [Flavitalea flava]